MISCQDLTHLTILLGYTVKGHVIKTVGVYIKKLLELCLLHFQHCLINVLDIKV